MREIKFRMWNNVAEASKMFYDTDNVMECLRQQINYNNKTEPCYNHEGDGSVFMQFTGLLDKNGKECYDGDIVVNKDGLKLKVIWYNIGWEMRLMDDKKVMEDYVWFNEFEIIGNIFETQTQQHGE